MKALHPAFTAATAERTRAFVPDFILWQLHAFGGRSLSCIDLLKGLRTSNKYMHANTIKVYFVTLCVQHVDTGELLMQAYADRAALSETLQTK